MVDKKIVILLFSIILLTGCGAKRVENNSYLKDFTNVTYIEGKSNETTTTTTTTTTEPITAPVKQVKQVVKTTKKAKECNFTNITDITHDSEYTGKTTSQQIEEAKAYILKYKDEILEMIELINVDRAKEGLAPLQYDCELTMAATIRSLEMDQTKLFEHARYCPNNIYQLFDSNGIKIVDNSNSDEGTKRCSSWASVYNELGINYKKAGENIARGFYSVQTAMGGFMSSPSHRKNIMKPDYNYVGIGVHEEYDQYGKLIGYWFSQEFAQMS